MKTMKIKVTRQVIRWRSDNGPGTNSKPDMYVGDEIVEHFPERDRLFVNAWYGGGKDVVVPARVIEFTPEGEYLPTGNVPDLAYPDMGTPDCPAPVGCGASADCIVGTQEGTLTVEVPSKSTSRHELMFIGRTCLTPQETETFFKWGIDPTSEFDSRGGADPKHFLARNCTELLNICDKTPGVSWYMEVPGFGYIIQNHK